ncbi:phage tail protein [Bacillus atrophaeus]|uniref:phage tail protein n=1 Tax=Bacillus atrophaeus TaxID=1452 RepID=UPI002E211EDD|nr:phage tail protein [Bacillus atrophaeus]
MSSASFIKEIAPDAQKIFVNYKILASLVIAQGCLESGYGTSGLAINGKNLFGVKGEYNGQYVIMKTWEVINGQNVQVNAKFRKYPSWYESMQDLAKLYVNGTSWDPNHYKAVVGETDYKKATAALVKAGYATDPSYATKLNNIIATYSLTKYDVAPGEPNTPPDVPAQMPYEDDKSTDLFIRSLTGQVELLTGFSVTRKSGINNEKTINITGVRTDVNEHAVALLKNDNILEYKSEPFVIKKFIPTPVGESIKIEAIAVHKMFIDLRDNYIYDIQKGVKAYRPDAALEIALAGTGYAYSVDTTGLATSVSIENFGDANSLSLLEDIVEKFGAEFECVQNTIYVAKEIARVTDNQIRYKLNVQDPQQEIDTSDIKTYIRGFGKGIEAEYTSPLASVLGIRHADPVRDDRYTVQGELLDRIKNDLYDRIDISIKLTYVELLEMGVQDIRKGDYVWCILDPFDIDIQLRVIEKEDYSDKRKSPKYTLGTLTKSSTDIVSEFNRTKKAVGKVLDGTTGKIKSSAVTIGQYTQFESGYDPTQLPRYSLANATTDGLMSSSDFVKLASIVLGPDGQISIALATETTNGLMSAADFAKLKLIKVGTSTVDLSTLTQKLTTIDKRLTALENK